MRGEPVFIVGVQRSGTTLTAAILAAHSRLSCGPETHFFRRLADASPEELIDPTVWPRHAVEFICSIRHSGFNGSESRLLLEKYQLERKQIEAHLVRQEPSIANILGSVTEQFMVREGKNRWVEKTPDHISYLHSIREHFPSSPIIRIVRDPRDVALSLTKVPWGAKSFLEGLLYWKRLADESRQFFLKDSCSYTLRFEDLVSSPHETLQKLCDFIGEEFEEGMLDTSLTGERVNSRRVPWKAKVSQPLDSSRVSAWRAQLSRQENQLAEAFVGNGLDELGYARDEKFACLGEIFPVHSPAAKYSDGLGVVSAAGVRFWNAARDEPALAKIFLGSPERNRWLTANGMKRILEFISLCLGIARARLLKKPIYWIPDSEKSQWPGYSSLLLQRLLEPFRLVQ